MGNCGSCSSQGSCSTSDKANCGKLAAKYGKIKHIIGIISGKGGVGKSTITGILAVELKKAGFKVGVLDADITGPSMPRFFGINEKRAMAVGQEGSQTVKFMPVETELGIKVISLNLLTEVEEQPVIWRGPVITGVLQQMYQDTEWGELDYLLIDMPPGTGDVALTVMQSLPLDGVVVVAIPQDMVTMIVKKVIIMAEKMNVPVLGLVENMAYIQCEHCDTKMKVFSKKSTEYHVEKLEVPLLEEMPIDLELVEKVEQGKAEELIYNSTTYKKLADNFLTRFKE